MKNIYIAICGVLCAAAIPLSCFAVRPPEHGVPVDIESVLKAPDSITVFRIATPEPGTEPESVGPFKVQTLDTRNVNKQSSGELIREIVKGIDNADNRQVDYVAVRDYSFAMEITSGAERVFLLLEFPLLRVSMAAPGDPDITILNTTRIAEERISSLFSR